MKTKVKRWGKSVAIRIPATVVRAMHLDFDDLVDVREEAGRIVIEPVLQKSYEVLPILATGNRHF